MGSGRVVGFALGAILKKPFNPWTYGCFFWIGVKRRLYRELEKRFREKRVRIVMVDMERTNLALEHGSKNSKPSF